MKKLTALILALMLCISSCAALAAYPVTLKDQTGREVTIESMPERMVSGYYISTSACIALGLEERMAAVEAKADKRNIYRLAAPELIELPNVGTAKAFDLEACLAAEPQLVILPKRLKDAAASLAEFGIPALLVNPESGEQLEQMIALIGEATGTQERAKALLDFSAAQLESLEQKLAGVQPVSALMLGNSDYLTCAPGDMYQTTVLENGGALNAAAELTGGDFAALSYEQLLAMNPAALMIPAEASYTAADVLADAELAAIDAVKNGAVYAMPRAFEAWDSPVPSGVLGAVWTAHMLHPQLVTREDYVSAAKAMYETFYGFTPDEAAL